MDYQGMEYGMVSLERNSLPDGIYVMNLILVLSHLRGGPAQIDARSVDGLFNESFAHSRYIWLKKIGRRRRPALDAA